MTAILDLFGAITRPLIIFDTETTGPNPREDRIVELGFMAVYPDGHTREWRAFVNPTIPIPHEATYGNAERGYPGHGITDAMVVSKATFRDYAPHLLKGFHDCDYGGFNVMRYDLPLLQAEFKRAGHPWSYTDARVLDGFRLWQLGEARTLSDAVEHFLKRTHEGAHGALSDVNASLEVIVAQLQQFTELPRDLAELHDLQFPKNPNAIDPDGKIVWKDGVAVMNFGKRWKGIPLREMPQRDLRWIIFDAKEVSDEVKQLCRDALVGKFPVKEEA